MGVAALAIPVQRVYVFQFSSSASDEITLRPVFGSVLPNGPAQ